jgi:RNA polymerase sigma-70 factor (ECF subfamily)
LEEKDLRAEFDRVALPHLDAAYDLARWLTRHDQDAEDVVQEAFLRAFQFFHSFHGETGRAWMLQIVRNTCYTWLAKNRSSESPSAASEVLGAVACSGANPETLIERREDRQTLMQAIDRLPVEFREVIVLRELEELPYKEIARIADIPLGTVMSRLARAREKLHEILDHTMMGNAPHGLPQR